MLLREVKDIYMIAICGTAMGSLAAMLKSQGYKVSGSDSHVYPPMSTFLASQGIQVYEGFDPAHLDPKPDLVIIGNAMSRGNPEVEAVLERKIPYTSLPEALKNFFIQGKTSIVVTGTHGKTTTTSLIAWLLEFAGKDPSFLIGGIPKNFGQGFKVGNSDLFVVEGDEYDTAFFDKAAKFFHYLPHILVINNIEFDHADIYDNLDQIKLAFRRLINLVPRNGLLLANREDANVMELSPRAFCPVETFGLAPDAFWRAEEIHFYPDRTTFDIFQRDKKFATVTVPLTGYHNIRNVLAAVGVANRLELTPEVIVPGLAQFQNIVKRLEVKGTVNGVTIYDDFAHHPTKVRSTINGLRCRYPKSKIWAVYEPRTATAKRKIMEDEYAKAFDEADIIILAALHLPEKVRAEERMSVESVVAKLTRRQKEAYYIPTVPEIVDFIVPRVMPGDQVLIMSNGAFDNIHQRLITKLNDRFGVR
ncbi:MAG: UDP-N-acetylmuramate:L-alanyl-gamma-D-glutamyl-meso-diaminopimelate ligase [candidate division KSB1 bacterium]|nr:UDP-N-acetylmuramate:L-alanyl-gamma-D-glutamyl-meso-diaminopimelate ligase [candidate division KSB1 bacterium]MDZ7335078.1 UDP-N-acetylmuramate:L-alanyl-gamma-D-glutamyl-meso-diaminopimelate ligase [candidate division KSB1 bacterium]MDZ7356253.1 UDP-N-acetylmuramate:L-alanyl-gamma-D-glutamyl-meso-diaminopimelate ligase [candidate division KSB1 bacterium]MDZ7375069.1 UDP-N-acetylmuramate:L-alanyl-gamma-D-glutamyl-meso-diaminopimelate ligase [candidate division KSB1 bacterium]MDZ7400058.1 UDP-